MSSSPNKQFCKLSWWNKKCFSNECKICKIFCWCLTLIRFEEKVDEKLGLYRPKFYRQLSMYFYLQYHLYNSKLPCIIPGDLERSRRPTWCVPSEVWYPYCSSDQNSDSHQRPAILLPWSEQTWGCWCERHWDGGISIPHLLNIIYPLPSDFSIIRSSVIWNSGSMHKDMTLHFRSNGFTCFMNWGTI